MNSLATPIGHKKAPTNRYAGRGAFSALCGPVHPRLRGLGRRLNTIAYIVVRLGRASSEGAAPRAGGETANWVLRQRAPHQTYRDRKVARERHKSRLLSILLLAVTSFIIWGVTELLTRVRRLAEGPYARLRQACLRGVWRRRFGGVSMQTSR